tara:strand:- start:5058 stop:5159 length:102 start_codon:yes stop_codon:yes gene_type:complete
MQLHMEIQKVGIFKNVGSVIFNVETGAWDFIYK